MENLEKLMEELKTLSKDELKKRFKNLTQEEKDLLNEGYKNTIAKCESINGHQYRGFNLYFILMLRGEGIYGTFCQWKEAKRSIKKGSTGVSILTPIFSDKDKTEIRFFKTIVVFNEEDTEILETST